VLLALATHLEVFLVTEGGQGGLSPYVFASVMTSLYQTVVAKQKIRKRQFYTTRFSATKSFMMELGVF
jgi:hypothetical protein